MNAHAMDFHPDGQHLFISGGVVGDEVGKFKDMLDANPQIKTAVFVNSQGGNLWAGMTLGRIIASKGLNTVAVGACVSSCSIMFMGGAERRFSNAWRAAGTYIGIHGPANQDGTLSPMQAPQMYAFYKQRMGDKFNSDLMNTALYDMKNRGSLLYAFEPIRNLKERLFHCVASGMPRAECTHYKDQDAMSLGIITHMDLYPVNLPQQLMPPVVLFGRTFSAPNSVPNAADMNAAFANIKDAQCTAAACTARVKNFLDGDTHKGVAVALDRSGFGLSVNSNSFAQSANTALYQCNHQAQQKRLCHIEFVDGHAIGGLYAEAKTKSNEVLAGLRALPNKSYADETQGSGVATQLKSGSPAEPTPLEVQGAQTVTTEQLVLALLGAARPVLIDVANDAQTLPSAHSLLFGGAVLADDKRDAAVADRFQAMLGLLAPDKSAPVVFYCASPQCWLSVNAALRAVKLGYSKVQWYRGGLQAWRAAGLATVQAAPQAIVN